MIQILILLITATFAFGHEVSEAFLRVERNGSNASGRFEVALRDAELVVGIDANHDDAITWNEITSASPKIISVLQQSIRLGGATPSIENFDVTEHSGRKFLAFDFKVSRISEEMPAVHYDFMFQFDRTHRALLKYSEGAVQSVAVLIDSARDFKTSTTPQSGFLEFVRQGVIHIWEGADHIAFLFTLLLPCVIGRASDLRAGEALVRICKIVTAFTLAHSITLALATVNIAHLPSRLVESAIAISVLIGAANNVVPLWRDRSWLVAFIFGLIHGFGFASALSDLQLHRSNLAPALFGFNGGVELGQLSIVALFFPVAFALRRTWFYRHFVLRGGSLAIAAVASIWIVERAFSFPIFSSTFPR